MYLECEELESISNYGTIQKEYWLINGTVQTA